MYVCMYVCKSALHVCFLFVGLLLSVQYSAYIHVRVSQGRMKGMVQIPTRYPQWRS